MVAERKLPDIRSSAFDPITELIIFVSTGPAIRVCEIVRTMKARVQCNRRTLDSHEIIRKGTSVKAGLAAVRFVESSQ